MNFNEALDKIADELSEAQDTKNRLYEIGRERDSYKWLGIECGLNIAVKILEQVKN